MVVAGVIAEYNPFHLGHAHHLRETRRRGATHIVAVMSGHFVQRGEPALLDKWTRTQAALLGGADLVLELPLPYAMATAQRFAFGAVAALDALGCVDLLSFGSECADLQLLQAGERLLQGEEIRPHLAGFFAQGYPFPKARQLAAQALGQEELIPLLTKANDILAMEYLAQLKKVGSSIEPLAIPRMGAGHDACTPSGGFASASWLREQITGGQPWAEMVPPQAAALYSQALEDGRGPVTLKALEKPILTTMRCLTPQGVQDLPDLSEGLENRLLAARGACSLEELFGQIKTKRYPLARIRRLVLSAFLGIPEGLSSQRPPYLQVLGANERGFQLLSRAKGTATVPLSHSLAKLERQGSTAQKVAALQAHSGDLWALGLPKVGPTGLEYTHPPVFLRGEKG